MVNTAPDSEFRAVIFPLCLSIMFLLMARPVPHYLFCPCKTFQKYWEVHWNLFRAVIPDDNFNFGAVNNFWNNAYGIVGISDAVANDICKARKSFSSSAYTTTVHLCFQPQD